jgi:integrase/recombinase XerD
MANRRVNLTKRVMVNGGLRYCPVVESALGRVKQDIVWVNDREERHPEGSYYIDFKVDGRRVRESVGTNAQEAAAKRDQKQVELAAKNNGLVVQEETTKRSLKSAVTQYLEEVKLTKKPKTYSAYSTSLEYFLESCPKQFLEDIERKDLLKFSAFLRDEKDQSPRSVANKFENVVSFLKAQKINTRELLQKNDWPSFTEEEPEIYEKEDLDKFFAACDEEERLWFEFFLMTGMREQEVMYTYWSDVNLNKHVVRVTHKPDRNWTPKAYREREIPIPDKLAVALKAWKAKSDKSCKLLFPTSGCKPKLDFLDCCKAAAERAGFNPKDFWLHKFRATFCTWHLWAGVDLRTCQSWMGHKDLESTMRYLKPNRGQEVRVKVNHTFA